MSHARIRIDPDVRDRRLDRHRPRGRRADRRPRRRRGDLCPACRAARRRRRGDCAPAATSDAARHPPSARRRRRRCRGSASSPRRSSGARSARCPDQLRRTRAARLLRPHLPWRSSTRPCGSTSTAAGTRSRRWRHTCARGGGYIVNVASLAGLIGVFGYADYAASKFAVVGFSEVLRSELAPHGITVSVLCPPDTDTPGFATRERQPSRPRRAPCRRPPVVLSAEQVADALLAGMAQRTFLIIPGRAARLAHLVKRIAPRLLERILDR